MGLFDKKYCDVCGEKIRFLGNRKLEDGNLCKDCAEKLSPWFSDRRKSTVEDIKAQLRYREENRAVVRSFQPDIELGEYGRIAIDTGKGQLAVLRPGESLSGNPDIVSLRQVRGCHWDVSESRREEKQKDAEGRLVSYDPPRHTYSYVFTLTVDVDARWFDDMQIRLNRQSVDIETGKPLELGGILSKAKVYSPQEPHPEKNADYVAFQALAEAMKTAILSPETQKAPSQEMPSMPEKQPEKVACPFCKAKAVPNPDGTCVYCGAKIL